ncbi:MAG: 4-(cytidine 5'-diphospho)-2-C-methyl-D-erythritol kinase [Acholeplasmatales bacterium]|nr:4-(cytidine 5'-diphospho)-2-C-methyl-D-erythritol kinase [Acholeplasmatales bacterium]
MITEYAYAKINLALEVMDVKDGYHMVNNLMVPIDLYDELTFEESNKIELINNEFEDNIILKAAKLFIERYHINKGVKITLKKNIPSAAGLAGGSSDGAAALRGLNKMFDNVATHDEMLEMAAILGSDVPFFIDSEIALCTNRGEVVNKLDVKPFVFDILLIKPETGLSTKEVYKNYIYEKVDKSEKIKNIINAIKYCDIFSLKKNIFNDLTKTALNLSTELNLIYQDLENRTEIYLSGSGPTMFLIKPDDKIVDYIKNKYKNCFVKKCKIKK